MLRLGLLANRTRIRPSRHFVCRRSSGAVGTRVKATGAKGSPSPNDVIKPQERAILKDRNQDGATMWVLKTFMKHLWPDSPALKARVAVAMSFLVGSKVN